MRIKNLTIYALSILLIPLWIYFYFSLFQLAFPYFFNSSDVASLQGVRVPVNKVKKIPVIMYHYVEINQDKKDFKRDSLNTLPFIFEKQIVTLKEAGYEFIWMSEITKVLNDNSNKKYVAITFDDGYESFYLQTYPILKKHGIKSTNYIIAGSLGKPNHMSVYQLQNIYSQGLLEIGSHTYGHPDLTSLSSEQVLNQLTSSKQILEKTFSTKIVSFCYPYGFYNEDTKKLVEQAGYTNATTTKLGSVVSSDNLFEINRIRPGIMTGPELLKYIDSINY